MVSYTINEVEAIKNDNIVQNIRMGDEFAYAKPDFLPAKNVSEMLDFTVNHKTQKYPFCIVWTPIPFLTWLFPCVGHMGIAMSTGVIRDFAGSYHVGTGNMAFGKPTKYWKLDPMMVTGGVEGWDKAVFEASEIYKNKNHNLFFDNCHSHVALALKKMNYKNSSWNMVKLAFLIFICGKYVNFAGFLKSWLPFFIVLSIILILVLYVP